MKPRSLGSCCSDCATSKSKGFGALPKGLTPQSVGNAAGTAVGVPYVGAILGGISSIINAPAACKAAAAEGWLADIAIAVVAGVLTAGMGTAVVAAGGLVAGIIANALGPLFACAAGQAQVASGIFQCVSGYKSPIVDCFLGIYPASFPNVQNIYTPARVDPSDTAGAQARRNRFAQRVVAFMATGSAIETAVYFAGQEVRTNAPDTDLSAFKLPNQIPGTPPIPSDGGQPASNYGAGNTFGFSTTEALVSACIQGIALAAASQTDLTEYNKIVGTKNPMTSAKNLGPGSGVADYGPQSNLLPAAAAIGGVGFLAFALIGKGGSPS